MKLLHNPDFRKEYGNLTEIFDDGLLSIDIGTCVTLQFTYRRPISSNLKLVPVTAHKAFTCHFINLKHRDMLGKDQAIQYNISAHLRGR